jgi:polar amino acid transport system substrate-binding protein
MKNKKILKKIFLSGFILAVLVVVVVSMSGCVSFSSMFHGSLPEEQTSANDTDSKLLIIGVDSTYPPFEYIEEGEMIGFDVDLASEIAKRLGKEIRLESIQWDTDFKLLREGSIDLIISAVPYNPEKDAIVDFSKPYFSMKYMLVSLSGSEVNIKEDLTGSKVGILEACAENLDPEYLADFEVVKYKEILELLDGLKVQDVSAIILSLPVATNLIKENTDLYNVLDEIISSQEFVVVYRKGSQLKGMIDTAIDGIKIDGTYDTIYNKWFGLEQ